MLKHYIFILFPVIMFGNSTYGMNHQHYDNFVTKQYYTHISRKCDKLEKKNTRLQNQYQEIENEIKILRQKNEELNNKVFFDSMRKKTIDKLKKQLSDIKVQLETKTEENNKLLYAIKQLNTEKEELNSKMKEIQQELSKIGKYNQNIKNILKDNNNLKKEQQNNIKIKDELSKIKEQYDKMKNKISVLTKTNNNLKQQLEGKEQQILNISEQEKERNQEISNLKQQEKVREQEISNLKQSWKELNQKLLNLRQQLKNRENEIFNLNKTKEEQEQKIYNLENQIEIKTKRFNNLQITSQSININNINELKQNKKLEYSNSSAKDINKISNNNSGVKNTNNGKQEDNEIKDNNSVQNINIDNTTDENINSINNVNDTNNIITNDSTINNNLNTQNINNEILNNNEITDEINSNKDIKDNKIEKTQNEVILKETKEENINKLENNNKVKKKKKHKKNNKKLQNNNNINLNQDTKQEIDTGTNSNILNKENKSRNDERIININITNTKNQNDKEIIDSYITGVKSKDSNTERGKIISSNINDIESKNNNKRNEEIVDNNINENHNHESCIKHNIRNLQQEFYALMKKQYATTSSRNTKSELFNKIITKYGEQRYNIKYLQDTANNILYTLLIKDNIKYIKDNYNMIQKQHQNMIDYLCSALNSEGDINAVKISPNAIELYRVNNNDIDFYNKNQITYRNLIFFMIGKILEIQKYNHDAKNVNETMKLHVPLMRINNTDILSFFPKNNIQNCVDLINNNIYYNVAFYDKCKNPILQKDILQHYSNENKTVQYLKDELEKDIKILKKYLETTKQNILYILHNLNEVNNNEELKTEVSNIIYKQYYKYYLLDILSYVHFLSISEINGSIIDCEYKKVIEILCNQLLCITNIVKTSTTVQQLIQRIDEMLRNSIDQFMPYIKYWNALYIESTKDYDTIINDINQYTENKNVVLSDTELTLENITNTINEFLQGILKLNYTFTF